MPEKKKPLWKRLEMMSEDIQIGGDVNFRSMSIVAAQAGGSGLSDDQIKDMERLLSRADRLLQDLREFWQRHPVLEKIVDRGHVAASDARGSNTKGSES